MNSKTTVHKLLKPILTLLLYSYISCYGQSDSLQKSLDHYTGKLNRDLQKKYTGLEKNITKQTGHYLKKLQQQETILYRKIYKTDSTKAKAMLYESQKTYSKLNSQLQSTQNKWKKMSNYIPGLDSLQTAGKFLAALNKGTKAISPEQLSRFTELSNTIGTVQDKMQSVSDIQSALVQRQKELQTLAREFKLSTLLKGYDKELYYYHQQINEYKELLHDDQKLEQKALALIRDIPAFKDFMQKNSMLSQLFPAPQNNSSGQALQGLQTRASVGTLIQQRMGMNIGTASNQLTADPQQLMQQQLQQAQGQLNQLKDKLNQLGNNTNGADITMPTNFKPNTQKTKSFWKRVEYGANIQSVGTNYFLPATTDIALTAGYKLNDKSVIGIGAAYKLGWGKPVKDIHISSEGIGLRSYLDIKLKGSIWMTGGYEQNYMQAFSKIPQLNDYSKWQQSGLIGMTKKLKTGKKTTNIQVLWDFLSYRQIPKGTPIKFRVGYTF